MIRKFPGERKYGLYSTTSGRRLGVFQSKAAAVKREQQINYFKNVKK